MWFELNFAENWTLKARVKNTCYIPSEYGTSFGNEMKWIIQFSTEGPRFLKTAEYLASSFSVLSCFMLQYTLFTLFKRRGSELYSNWFPVVLGVAEPLSECSAEARDDEAFKLSPTAGSVWGPSYGHGQTSVLPRLWLLLQSRESLALPKRTF